VSQGNTMTVTFRVNRRWVDSYSSSPTTSCWPWI